MTKIMRINGAPTVVNISEKIADKIYNITRFNYGIHEENNGGCLKITFDSMQDAQKFVAIYEELTR